MIGRNYWYFDWCQYRTKFYRWPLPASHCQPQERELQGFVQPRKSKGSISWRKPYDSRGDICLAEERSLKNRIQCNTFPWISPPGDHQILIWFSILFLLHFCFCLFLCSSNCSLVALVDVMVYPPKYSRFWDLFKYRK